MSWSEDEWATSELVAEESRKVYRRIRDIGRDEFPDIPILAVQSEYGARLGRNECGLSKVDVRKVFQEMNDRCLGPRSKCPHCGEYL